MTGSDEITKVECSKCHAWVRASEPKCPICREPLIAPRRTAQIHIAADYAREGERVVDQLEAKGSDFAMFLARQGRELVQRFQTWQTMMPSPPDRSSQIQIFSAWNRTAREELGRVR